MSLFDKKYLKRIDWVTVGIVLALVVFGTIALASVQAKPFDGTEHGIADYMDKLNMEYLQKHITNFLVGLAAMIIFLVFDYSIFFVAFVAENLVRQSVWLQNQTDSI